MKVYRELPEAEWEKVPARTDKQEGSEWGQHFRITYIMESLAQATGDVEPTRCGKEPGTEYGSCDIQREPALEITSRKNYLEGA
jgi:hypothetical protein